LNNDDLYLYAGKILRINLSDGKISIESTLKYAKDWIGSSGIAIKILYDEIKPWVTPYAPANKLIFASGALVGTTAPGANKMNVSTLGPMTGGWASGCSDSYVGGNLKFAGYDLLIIEGRAHLPVYLSIYDDQIKIKDASRLWGKTTWDTLEKLRKDYGNPELHIISIGPAGENLARGACIVQDKNRAFGRCGTGSVMGSKNLKAIVVQGTGQIKIAKPKEFMELVRNLRGNFKKGIVFEKMQKHTSLNAFLSKQQSCGIQFKNFQECIVPEEWVEKIDPRKTIEKYEISQQSFPGCPYGGCGKHLYLTEGPYAGLQAENNQYEVFNTLQARLAIKEPTFMIKANALCNQLGLDVDAAGGAIGWAMECFEKNIIDERDTDGLKLNWGDSGVVLELIRKIAYREGFGDLLAEGNAKAANILGRNSSYYALNIKGQDLYETCRGALGWALGAITSTRGGGHTTGATVAEFWPTSVLEKSKSIYGISNPNTPLEYNGKAEMVTFMETLHRISNCLGICHYTTTWYDAEFSDLPDLTRLYSLATGWDNTVEEFKYKAMKQLNLEKAFNLIHTNFNRNDDMPADRELNEPIPSGNLAGWKFDKEKLNKMLDEYYELHGWNKKNSFPTKKTLLNLGLENVAEDLKKIGKLG